MIVPVIKEVMALWSFHPRLTHCSFKNSTPVSAAGLVDPRVSQFSSWCVRVCPQTDIADIEHCFGKEEEGVFIFYEIAVEFLNWPGHAFYLVDFILMFTRPAPETGDVFRVCAIVPVITEDLALGSFLPRLTHNSFKNSTPVSAAGLVDPRGSQFSSWLFELFRG